MALQSPEANTPNNYTQPVESTVPGQVMEVDLQAHMNRHDQALAELGVTAAPSTLQQELNSDEQPPEPNPTPITIQSRPQKSNVRIISSTPLTETQSMTSTISIEDKEHARQKSDASELVLESGSQVTVTPNQNTEAPDVIIRHTSTAEQSEIQPEQGYPQPGDFIVSGSPETNFFNDFSLGNFDGGDISYGDFEFGRNISDDPTIESSSRLAGGTLGEIVGYRFGGLKGAQVGRYMGQEAGPVIVDTLSGTFSN